MVSHNTVNTFIVVGGGLWSEGYDDSCLRLSIDSAFNLRKRKDVFIISEELESSWKVAIVNDIQQSVCVVTQ